MTTKTDGGPAFPVPVAVADGMVEQSRDKGLTLRDYFAAQALAGLLAAHTGDKLFPDNEWAARNAFEYADAMLAARGR